MIIYSFLLRTVFDEFFDFSIRKTADLPAHVHNLPDDVNVPVFNEKEDHTGLSSCCSIPSLLKPVDGPTKYPYLEMRLAPLASSFEFPGALSNLTSFTYQPIDKSRYGGESERKIELAPITTFLAKNCPNLQHLRIQIYPSPYQYNLQDTYIDYYSKFVRILVAKPNRETPKTFTALDIRGLHNYPAVIAWIEDRLQHELAGWERTALGQYRSIGSRHSESLLEPRAPAIVATANFPSSSSLSGSHIGNPDFQGSAH